VLARRRGGLEGGDEEFVRPIAERLPQGAGSIAEGVGDINPTADIVPPDVVAALPRSDEDRGW
jgi:NADH-quinone oxidoreductase subunit J